MSYGVQSTGFVLKTLATIRSEMETTYKATAGADANVSSSSLVGVIIGIVAAAIASVWQVAQAVYRSLQADFATGNSLDNLCALTGVTRLAADTSTVTLSLNLAAGTTVAEGKIVSVGENGNQFELTGDAENAAAYKQLVSVEAESIDTGEVTAYAGTLDTIQTPVSGWTAKAAVVAGNSETYALSDGQTLTVKVDQGAEQTATFNTADFGAIGAATAAEVAAVINTDITGVTASDQNGSVWIESDTDGGGSAVQVTGGTANASLGFSTTLSKGMNASDATLGRDQETDAALRLRRVQLLRATGSATVEAIRADLLTVDDVEEAVVYENDTMATVDGIPAKAFEAVVLGGTDADVAEQIWESKPAGIQPYGTSSENVTDSMGNTQAIGFTRPTEVTVHIAITVVQGDDYAGDAAVKAAIVAAWDLVRGISVDVVEDYLRAAAWINLATGVSTGIADVTSFTIGTTDPPVGTSNISIGARQVGDVDTANIDVTS